MLKKLRFIAEVTFIHLVTYILCSLVFSVLIGYEKLYAMDVANTFMSPFGGGRTLIMPLVQILRGILFGVVLLWLKPLWENGRFGWVKIWGILLLLGLVNPFLPAPASIQGLTLTQLPFSFQMALLPEVLVQSLMLSYFSCAKKKTIKVSEKEALAIMPAVLGLVLYSLSGILTAAIIKADIFSSSGDIGSFALMGLTALVVYIISKVYMHTQYKYKMVVCAAIYYALYAVAPVLYNFFTKSVFSSWIPLLLNLVIVGAVLGLNYYIERRYHDDAPADAEPEE